MAKPLARMRMQELQRAQDDRTSGTAWRVAGTAAAVVFGALFIRALPDLLRYAKIERM
jgi:hypothetical protein